LTCLPAGAFNFRNLTVDNGLPGMEVYQVIQDREGYIWFATDRGVSRYDGYEFKSFSRVDGMPDEVVFGFHLDSRNRLWFYSHTGGVFYYQDGKITEPAFNRKLIRFMEDEGNLILSSMYVDAWDRVWLGFLGLHLVMIGTDGQLHTVASIPKPSLRKTRYATDLDSTNADGLIFSGMMTLYPLTIHYRNAAGNNYSVPVDHPVGSKHTFRGYFYRAPDNILYFGGGRILFKIYQNRVIQSVVMPEEFTDCIRQDLEGNLWVGTFDGIYRFRSSDLESTPDTFLRRHAVSSFLQDKEGGYWFTTLGAGVYYLPTLEVISVGSQYTGLDRIHGFIKTKDGVYAFSDANSTFFEDGNVEKPFVLNRGNSLPGKWNDYIVYAYGFNSLVAKGKTMMLKPDSIPPVRQNDGLSKYCWSSITNNITIHKNYDRRRVMSIVMRKKTVRNVAVSPSGEEVWIATISGLYYHRDGNTEFVGDRFAPFGKKIADLDYFDNENLLITTRDNGAYVVNTRRRKCRKLIELPGEHCTNTVIEPDSTVWIACFPGVTRITDPFTNPRTVHYTVNDGILSNTVYAILVDSSKVWLATASGISVFRKNWIPPVPSDPSAKIIRVSVNERDTTLASAYRLPYDGNSIRIIFSGVSYRNPARYYYRMSGLQSDWLSTTDHFVSFSSLRPGKYTFEATTTLPDRAAPGDIVRMSFIIRPPLWKTAWFQVLVAVLILSLVLAYIGTRYRFIRKEDRLYRLVVRSEQKALRAQINPHFIFNAISSALGLLREKKHGEAGDYLLNFSALMRKILEHSRTEEVNLVQEADLLESYIEVERLRFGHLFSHTIEMGQGIDPENIFIPSMTIQPYVENALKYGIMSRRDGKGDLRISFARDGGRLVARISDNGPGIQRTQARKKKHLSLGLRINEERARISGTQKKRYEISIRPLNAEDERFPGTVIVLEFPLNDNHI